VSGESDWRTWSDKVGIKGTARGRREVAWRKAKSNWVGVTVMKYAHQNAVRPTVDVGEVLHRNASFALERLAGNCVRNLEKRVATRHIAGLGCSGTGLDARYQKRARDLSTAAEQLRAGSPQRNAHPLPFSPERHL